MLVAVLGLVVLAVLVWPSRGHPTAPDPASATDLPDGLDVHEGFDAATPTVDQAADALVLCALALRSGLGAVEALEVVADRVPAAVGRQLRVVASAQRWGQDAATAWDHVGDGWLSASVAWQASERSGASPSAVLLAAAGRMRSREAARVEAAVQRAGVLLVLPLGACFLPGFLGTTVVPVVLHLARASLDL